MRAFRISLCAAVLAIALPAHADWLLYSFATRVVAGQPFTSSLLRDASAADEPLPERLKLIAESGERLLSLDLAPAGQTAGSAIRRDFVGDWPVVHAADPRHLREASNLVTAYLSWHLERGLRSMAYVER